MRIMTPALEVATKDLSHVPAVRVCLYNKRANTLRPRFSLLYTGSEEDNFHAACFAGDGSLLRARIQTSTPNYALFYSRVSSPGTGSDYSQWTFTGSVSPSSKVALASFDSNVLLFALDVDNLTIKVKESTDNGLTWTDWVNIYTAPITPGYLAAAFNGDGSICVLFYNIGGTIYAVRRSDGLWGVPSPWADSLSDVTGLAAIFDAEWRLAVCGQDNSGRKTLGTCSYTTSFSWTALQQVMAADAGTSISFYYPSLDKPSPFMLFFLEHFGGLESYWQTRWSATAASSVFSNNLWMEAMGFNPSSPWGYDLIHDSLYLWLVNSNKVFRTSLSSGLVDVSSDVLRINVDSIPSGARAQIALRNDAGQYNNPTLGLGAQLEIQWGYQTVNGPAYTTPVSYWVERLEYVSQGSLSSLVLHCSDAWSFLKNLRARYQYVWPSGSGAIQDILKWLLSRAGLAMQVLSSSQAFTEQRPAFTVYANEDYETAIRRLMARVPDVFFFRGNTAYVLHPQASDASEYRYGAGHAILEGRYISSAAEFNSFAVYGNGITTYDWDWDGVEMVWERLIQVEDKNLSTVAAAHQRGLAMQRRAAINSTGGMILVPLHPGQELYDVIDITDSRSGLNASRKRVSGLRHHYDSQKGEYNLEIRLMGV